MISRIFAALCFLMATDRVAQAGTGGSVAGVSGAALSGGWRDWVSEVSGVLGALVAAATLLYLCLKIRLLLKGGKGE